MNPTSTPDGLDPANPLSIEDDPVLQAIEAHEARPDDIYTKHVAPAVPSLVVPERPEPPVAVIVEPEPTPVVVTPVAPLPEPAAKPEVVVPKTPQTPAEEIAEEIANNPPTKAPFQFFIHQQISKKSLIVIFAIIVVILIGIGAFVVINTPR